jgi:hypothetical protein
MRVLSVNVGLPREVTWRGKPVTTGIYKQPVAGRVAVRTLNLDGDRQADLRVHGGWDKAVYAYPSEFYARTHRTPLARARVMASDASGPCTAWRRGAPLLVVREFVGCASSGVCGPVEKVGEQFEFVLVVSRIDLVHPAVHSGVEAHEVRVTRAFGADKHGPAVGWVALAGHPAAAFEPVEDAGDRGGVETGPSREGAGAERAVTIDQVEAIEVDVPQIELGADQMVKQRQLAAQLTE